MPGSQIFFEDNFNAGTLGPEWSLRGTDYSASRPNSRGDMRAVSLDDGLLTLSAIPDPDRPGKWLNGHIGTQGAVEFIYGVVTAWVRFQPFHGSHGAVWAQSTEGYTEDQAEIDIAEYFGVHNPNRKSAKTMYHHVYYREPTTEPDAYERERFTSSSEDFGRWDAWHEYSWRWGPKAYTFRVDGAIVGKVTKPEALSDRPKFLVLSMLTNPFEEPDLAHGHPWPSMQVSRIKVRPL